MGFMKPEMPSMTPQIIAPKEPPPPAPIVGQRPQRKPMQPTFLGTGSAPLATQASAPKSLLGQ